jgi:lipopolysaccharide export system protein LptC
MIHRANRLFPIALVVLMGSMTLWLDQISQLTDFGRKPNPDKPEYISEQVVATRFDKLGRIEQRLVADRLWQFPNSNALHFSDAYLRVFQNGAPDLSLTAPSGYYDTSSKQAYFDHEVHMTKAATAAQPETLLDSSMMSVDTVKRYANSAMPTVIHYGPSVAHTTGFTYDYAAGQLNMLSFAKATYVH